MRKILLFISYSIYSLHISGQIPNIEWKKCYGGTDEDKAYSIQQTTDGGYILAGYSYSNDGDASNHHGNSLPDCWVVKLDNTGNIKWQKSLGGTSSDEANSIQQTTDGGYIFAGITFSNDGDVSGNHGYLDCWVVKLDSIGDIQWQKTLGGSNKDWAKSIEQTSDGGYIVVGYSLSNDGDVIGGSGNGYIDYWVVKLDVNGGITWQKTLGGTRTDYGFFGQQTNDGGYIIAGSSGSNDGDITALHGGEACGTDNLCPDYWIVKLDHNGNIQWEKSFGGTFVDMAFSIQQTKEDGYIIAGHSASNDGDVTGHHADFDVWVVKLNNSGSIEWQKSLGGSKGDYAYSIQQTSSGYIIGGSSESNDGDVNGVHSGICEIGFCGDYWLVKIDTVGNIQWQKSLGGANNEEIYSFKQTNDGGYIVAGFTMSEDGDVSGNHGQADFWVVKLTRIVGVNENNTFNNFSFYPNPATNLLTIESKSIVSNKELATIYDLTGKLLMQFSLTGEKTTIDISSLTPGIYFLSLYDGEQTLQRKFIKQ